METEHFVLSSLLLQNTGYVRKFNERYQAPPARTPHPTHARPRSIESCVQVQGPLLLQDPKEPNYRCPNKTL